MKAVTFLFRSSFCIVPSKMKRFHLNISQINLFKNIRRYFRQYCSCSSIHGLRYLAEKRSIFEWIWWSTTFVISVFTCIFVIYGTYEKWKQAPVIINFSNKLTSIHTVPFPAVTICHSEKYSKDKLKDEFLFDNLNLTLENKKKLEFIGMLCKRQGTSDLKVNEILDEEFYEIMNELKIETEFIWCKIDISFSSNCQEILTPIITPMGICYSYNILDRSDIFKENVIHFSDYHKVKHENQFINYQYLDDKIITSYPKRSSSAGLPHGSWFGIKSVYEKNISHNFCTLGHQSFLIFVHSPTNIPGLEDNVFWLPYGKSVVLSVEPSMITTSKSLRWHNVEKRGCYFQSENFLRYFKIYTLSNCRLECLTNITLHYCKCVAFFMPRENGTSLCGTKMNECLARASRESHKITSLGANRIQKKNECKCLPACTDLNYNAVAAEAQFRKRVTPDEVNNYSFSNLIIYFKSNYFVKLERNELYGVLDFLGNVGGLLGLFTGFSLMSLMEILYFLSIRIIVNKRLYGRWWG